MDIAAVNGDDGTTVATHLPPEPQAERGRPGARGSGPDASAGRPEDRPTGTADEDSDTAVDGSNAQHPHEPDLPTGDQAG
jgi:hypothetical protein